MNVQEYKDLRESILILAACHEFLHVYPCSHTTRNQCSVFRNQLSKEELKENKGEKARKTSN